MSIGTLLCWGAWVFVLLTISPADAGLMGFFSFYLSFFLAVVGTFSVLGFAIRRAILRNDDIVFRHVRHTFRQSIFISTALIIILMLLSKGLLFWWNAAILLVFFLFIETIIFTNRKHSNGALGTPNS
jgi:hypothetical protein